MAFNPFHRFRKHQKGIFAVMAIICMFVFILQFGRGDAIEKALNLVGYSRAKGEVAITLYGKKIREGDLQALSQRRQAASEFLQRVCALGLTEAVEDYRQVLSKSDDAQAMSLQGPFSNWGFRRLFEMQGRFIGRNEQIFQQVTQDIRTVDAMREIQETIKGRSDLAKAAKALVAALEFDAWKYDPRLPKDELFFGGTTKTDDLLDFMVWQHQADKLGIVLDEGAVLKATNEEAGGRPVLEGNKFAESVPVRNFFAGRKNQALTPHDLLDAVREEFRVALAQETLLGLEAGARAYRNAFARTPSPHQSPAAGTPDEFLQYYREQRTTLSVGLLPIAVKDFVGKVEASPSKQDLLSLYERYKSFEPAPDRREPGFKEPRRARVEYLTAKADASLYTKLAARTLDIQEGLLRFAPPLTTLAGGGVAGWAASTAAPYLLPPDATLLAEYESYRERIRPWNDAFRLTPSELHDSSIQRPENAASTVAQLLGAAGTGGSALAAPATFVGTGTLAEVRDSLKFHTALLLANTSPTPFTTVALVQPFTPKVLPLDAVKPQLREKLQADLAPQIMTGNLAALATELNKVKNKAAEAKAFLEKFKEKDIFLDSPIVSMDELKTIHTIADDLKLRPLKEEYEAARTFNPQQPEFAQVLLSKDRSGPYDARFVVDPRLVAVLPRRELSVFWRAEDKPARERSFEEARADVEAAWKLQAARPLALQEAERIRQALDKKLTNKDDIERFLADQKQGKPIYLSDVARLKKIPSPLPGRTEYERYRPPASEVPYPPATFVRQLLTLKKEGDAVVIKDVPEKTFYVAVLLVPRDDRRNFKEFADLYEKTPDGDTLWQNWFMQDRRREFQRRVLEQLRAEAGPLEDGKFVLSENIKTRGDSSEPVE
jgi:hypothetical protein